MQGLIDNINLLEHKELVHIFNILKTNNIEYTKNSNGVFFNLQNIDKNVFQKLSDCVNIIINSRKKIISLDKAREAEINYYKSLLEHKIKENVALKNQNSIDQYIIKDSGYYPFNYIVKKVCRENIYSEDELKKVDENIKFALKNSKLMIKCNNITKKYKWKVYNTSSNKNNTRSYEEGSTDNVNDDVGDELEESYDDTKDSGNPDDYEDADVDDDLKTELEKDDDESYSKSDIDDDNANDDEILDLENEKEDVNNISTGNIIFEKEVLNDSDQQRIKYVSLLKEQGYAFDHKYWYFPVKIQTKLK